MCMHLQGVEMTSHLPKGYEELKQDQTTEIPDGVLDLQKMQNTIKAVEKAMVEEMEKLSLEAVEKAMEEEVERLAVQESVNANIKVPAESEEIQELKLRGTTPQVEGIRNEETNNNKKLIDNRNCRKTKAENGILMKDIPLDQESDSSLYGRNRRTKGGTDEQMLELWETTEQDCSQDAPVHEQQNQAAEPIDKLEVSFNRMRNQENNKGKILERLVSDARKLTNLQRSVHDLKKKMELNKKSNKVNYAEFEMVQRQLLEVEEAIVQLADVNDQLTRDIEEEGPSSLDEKSSGESEEGGNVQQKRVTEQARKGAEKIGQLQFELQNIQYILLKLEDEHKSKGKTSRFAESKTGVLLRDFIYSSRRSRQKRKKGRFCGCSRPSTRED